MKLNKLTLALIAYAALGMSTVHAAADADAIALFDPAVPAVVGLAPTLELECVGVNLGIHRVATNKSYSGTFTVTAPDNQSSSTATKNYDATLGATGIAHTSDSAPDTGWCRLTGLSAPTPADYKLTMSSNTNLAFKVGNNNDVTNNTNQRPAATASPTGSVMSADLTVVNATPVVENTNNLYWRIAGTLNFTEFTPVVANYGGHQTDTNARADVDAAD